MYNAYMHLHWLPTFCLAYLLFIPLSVEWSGDSSLDNENLGEVITNSGGYALPTGALNFRKSAHFIEINSIYGAEMTRRVSVFSDCSLSISTNN